MFGYYFISLLIVGLIFNVVKKYIKNRQPAVKLIFQVLALYVVAQAILSGWSNEVFLHTVPVAALAATGIPLIDIISIRKVKMTGKKQNS